MSQFYLILDLWCIHILKLEIQLNHMQITHSSGPICTNIANGMHCNKPTPSFANISYLTAEIEIPQPNQSTTTRQGKRPLNQQTQLNFLEGATSFV